MVKIVNIQNLILTSLLCFSLCSYSQDAITLQQSGVDLNVLYRNEMTFGFVVHSHGMGMNYRRGQHVTGFKTRFLDFDLVSMKHPKQTKTTGSSGFTSAKGFYYGKLNALTMLRAGAGYQRILFGKAGKERKSVEIRSVAAAGLSIGMAKPVYLQILKSPSEGSISIERYDPARHALEDIYGRAPYSRGLYETKFYPGAYAKLALSVEYADKHKDIKAIETGAMLDAFSKAIPVMATEKNSPLFFTFYINFLYGQRWF